MAVQKSNDGHTAASSFPTNTLFEVEFTNIRGLHSNLNAVHHHLETVRPALLFLTETQIRRPADTTYLHYPGYILEENFRAKAGVCLFVRADVCCRRLRCLEDPSFSVLWVHVNLGSKSRIYACLYRSHSGDTETTRLFDNLSQAADDALGQFPNAELVVLGDFNAHHETWLGSVKTDHAGRTAHAFALTHDLTQLVLQPTRMPDIVGQAPSLLDLLLTSHPAQYSVSVQAQLGTSDHFLVRATVPFVAPTRPAVVKRRLWHYSSADWDGMRDYFASIPWPKRFFENRTLAESASAVADEILLGMEYYIPFTDVTSNGKARPWFNRECAYAVEQKQSAYRAWIRARSMQDPQVDLFKAAYNKATKVCKRAYIRADAQRVARFSQDLMTHPTGSRSYWRLAKAVQSNFCQPSLPPLRYPDGSLAHQPQEKADLLADLFAANSRVNDRGTQPPTIDDCGISMREIRIRQCDVRAILRSLDVRKASGPDGIPAVVLKKCAAELSPTLTRLYRLSYSSGIVPQAWKEANVQAVPKKGDRSDPGNYRPIAITSILCKVFERIINGQLIRYLEDHSLINDRQYGFRPKRSTGDLLAYVTHLWGEAMDKHGESLAISLDISKAFDRVWHRSLLSKLPGYGLPPQLCNWVADFLHGRRIRVLCDGRASQSLPVNAGVPQGSVLSPTLFLLHINDLLNSGSIHCYADDGTVHGRYLGHPATKQADIEENRRSLVAELDRVLNCVSQWGSKNLVEFNAKKTQACAFSAKMSPFLPFPSLQTTPLPIQDSLNILGMDIQRDLNSKNYIEGVIKTASKKLGILKRVGRFFTPEQLCLLYKTQVRPCVEYCSHLWNGSAQYLFDALDKLQRRAIRIIGNVEITKTLEPLQLRRDIASLAVFYRMYHGECSEELFQLIPPSPFLSRNTRAGLRCHRFTVEEIPSRTKRFGASYLCRTIKVWNSLPTHVFPSSFDPGSFKRGVKKHLLRPSR